MFTRITPSGRVAPETAMAARKESRVTFVHLSSGYQGENGLKTAFPYVKAIKQKVGLLVGVQFSIRRAGQ